MINISGSFSFQFIHKSQYLSDKDAATNDNYQSIRSSGSNGGEQVNISTAGKDKLKQEQSQVGKSIAEQIHEQSQTTTDEIKSATEQNRLDKMIKEVKEQLKSVQQELSKVKNNRQDKSDKRENLLRAQLITLNGTLIALIGKKMEALKA